MSRHYGNDLQKHPSYSHRRTLGLQEEREKKRRRKRKRGENDGVKDWRSGAGESEEKKAGRQIIRSDRTTGQRQKRVVQKKKKEKKKMDKEGMRPQLQETGIWASVAEREKSCEGWVSGTGDNNNNSCSAPFGAFSNTLSLCANMKMTLSSIGFCTFSLAFTHIQSRRTVNKAISVLGTLLNKTKKKVHSLPWQCASVCSAMPQANTAPTAAGSF